MLSRPTLKPQWLNTMEHILVEQDEKVQVWG